MTSPQGRLAEVLRRGARKRQAEGPRRQMGVQPDMAGAAVAGPTAVQLAIELAQSFGSGPRLETPASSSGIDARVPISENEAVY